MAREGLMYTDSDEWVQKKDNNILRVGITDHAQSELGDIVYVDLPEIGEEYDKGDDVNEIESVKAVAEVKAPVSGKIVAINDQLEDDPALLNEEPFDNGWIFEIEMTDPDQLENLMDLEEYESKLEE
ncbi:MAG: glycine cleavage system protein GcvH [Candidatus Mcinerneyibacterium aminivorans]|jgi:glycine cleavage system H protein|uniref:Glycine cleavage system H protein n=1 Tax=Candidatus Mcinerneyibacterium aminivorans TaxID=2703815 RepID=A0A5D0MKV8_9BACT|nr:MAG: glycine cleavage system protein GcvH [Candidatus Mcinerneyibacterium aminivorans]